MASINLRKGPGEPVIDEIVFSNHVNNEGTACAIVKAGDSISITTGYYSHKRERKIIKINKGDTPYLLEAIEKAKELGWV